MCLDVDGTLAPIAPTPAAARVPRATRRLLERFARHHRTTLVLVSGRHPDDARRVAGVVPDWTIGNHGFEIARRADRARPMVAPRARGAVARAAPEIARAVADLAGVRVESKGWTVAVHYRAAGARAAPLVWRRVRQAVGALAVTLHRGKRVVDVRPAFTWDKGLALERLLTQLYGATWTGRAGVLYAGDDVTDEAVFRRLAEPAVTVKVGAGRTLARYRTRSPATLARWLARLERDL